MDRGALALELREVLPFPTMTAQVIAREGVPWFRNITIDKGLSDGVKLNAPVLAVGGVMGRVVAAGPHAAKVQLLLDRDCGVGVRIERTRTTGVVAGQVAFSDSGTSELLMKYVPVLADVVVGDVVDLSGIVPRPVPTGLIRFRDGLCPRLSRQLERTVQANQAPYAAVAGADAPPGGPRLKTGGIYVHSPGPWFETPTEDRVYRRLGFDVVGKTAGPEFRLARMYRMCLGILSIVVNPAEGLGEFEHADLQAIYERCGPVLARLVLEAMAGIGNRPGEPEACHCAEVSGISLFGRFAPFARYRGDVTDV